MSSADRTVVKHKTELDRDQAADILEALAKQLRRGRFDSGDLTVAAEAHSAVRAVPAMIHLDLEVKDSPKNSGVKKEVELELWWLDSD